MACPYQANIRVDFIGHRGLFCLAGIKVDFYFTHPLTKENGLCTKKILALAVALSLLGGNAVFAQEDDSTVAVNSEAEAAVEINADVMDDQAIYDEGYGADDEYLGGEGMEVGNTENGEENTEIPEDDLTVSTNTAQ